MRDDLIHTEELTKDYGQGRGIFDVELHVEQGEIFGYVGTNGSGKTTTIRHMMGFIRPNRGCAKVCGLDAWNHSTELMNRVSYVPEEIAFPSLSTGTEFLKSQADYLGVKDFTYMNHIIELLQLDPSANLKRMSKGMKQKTAIVAALMADREILILDEPTTGLDPLMREAFLDLIREEKKRGKTVFMSSHIFEEIEEVCDRVAMIRDGRIVDTVALYQLRHWQTKHFDLTFATGYAFRAFLAEWGEHGGEGSDDKHSGGHGINSTIEDTDTGKCSCSVELPKAETGRLFRVLSHYTLSSLHEEHPTLEQYFKKIYQKGER